MPVYQPLEIRNRVLLPESWGISFRCEGLTPVMNGVQVYLGWGGLQYVGALDGSWGTADASCPADSSAAGDHFACAGSAGDGTFGAFMLPDTAFMLGAMDEFRVGLMLRRTP